MCVSPVDIVMRIDIEGTHYIRELHYDVMAGNLRETEYITILLRKVDTKYI